MKTNRLMAAAALGVTLMTPGYTDDLQDFDADAVAALDTEYQEAVEKNDWRTMDRILHRDFTLVLGNGQTYSRAELIESARKATHLFKRQVEMPGTQQVRLFGRDTATVTALLWLKGSKASDGSEFEYKLWFSDTYVRTRDGWRYAFGQASLRLP
jgi:ketosteroid isomerase-like protein